MCLGTLISDRRFIKAYKSKHLFWKDDMGVNTSFKYIMKRTNDLKCGLFKLIRVTEHTMSAAIEKTTLPFCPFVYLSGSQSAFLSGWLSVYLILCRSLRSFSCTFVVVFPSAYQFLRLTVCPSCPILLGCLSVSLFVSLFLGLYDNSYQYE